MAGRTSTKRGAAAVEADASTDATENAAPEQVETDLTEGTENTDTSAEAAPAAKPEESKKKDDKTAELAAFKTTVEAAVAARAEGDEDTSAGSDPITGAVSDEVLAGVVKSYQTLTGDRKAQNAAKQVLIEGLGNAVDASNDPDKMASAIATARAYLAVQKAIDEAGPSKSAAVHKTPVDPTEVFVNLYSTLDLALAVAYNTVPDGVADDWQARAEKVSNDAQGELTTYLTWLATPDAERGDEPDVSAMVKDAVKLAQGKGTAGRKSSPGGPRTPFEGERGDIAKHIAQAFADVAVGETLTVAQIVAKDSKGAGYEGRKPSQGAVSSRLKSGAWSVEQTGIKPIEGSAPFAAEKVADPKSA